MPLITIPSVAHPRKFGWLVPGENCSQVAYDLCVRADLDVGTLEVPVASNRGPRIDAFTKRGGIAVPKNPRTPGVYWCALAAGCWAADVGLRVPQNFGGTDYWLPYVKDGRWNAKPEAGDFVIYGLRRSGPVVSWGNAHHIELIVRVPEPDQPLTLTIGGNRSYAGTTSNNGVAVDIGPMMRQDILGYVSPEQLGRAA